MRSNGERVLVADVDVGVARARRPGGDHQPFDDEVRVALHERAVHPRARVAFVRVADEVLRLGGRGAQEVPLAADREVRAAAPAEAGIEHLLDDRLVRHVERLREALVAAVREVVVDVLGVGAAGVRHQAADLALHERVVREQRDLRRRVAFDDAEREFRHVHAVDDRRLDELLDAVGGDVP